jgi:hypothetical protein
MGNGSRSGTHNVRSSSDSRISGEAARSATLTSRSCGFSNDQLAEGENFKGNIPRMSIGNRLGYDSRETESRVKLCDANRRRVRA